MSRLSREFQKQFFCGNTFFLLCLDIFYSRSFATAPKKMTNSNVEDAMSIVYVTCPNTDTANSLARFPAYYSNSFTLIPQLEKRVVERKLAACCNVIPGVTSYYEWQGKIQSDSEILLMMKTRSSRVEEISKFMKENHPYDVPEVISTKIESGSVEYMKWIRDVVPSKSQ